MYSVQMRNGHPSNWPTVTKVGSALRIWDYFKIMAKRKVTIFHNARCSKCREAMEILEDSNCEIEVVEYLKEIPTKKELKDVLMKLDLKPFDLIRTKEELFEKSFSASVKVPEMITKSAIPSGIV